MTRRGGAGEVPPPLLHYNDSIGRKTCIHPPAAKRQKLQKLKKKFMKKREFLLDISETIRYTKEACAGSASKWQEILAGYCDDAGDCGASR